jgi:hypothetical protein
MTIKHITENKRKNQTTLTAPFSEFWFVLISPFSFLLSFLSSTIEDETGTDEFERDRLEPIALTLKETNVPILKFLRSTAMLQFPQSVKL